jgi:hypothetical protein
VKRNKAIGETKAPRSPCYIAPRHFSRAPGKQRQRPPYLAFEVEDAVRDVVPEGRKRAMNLRALAAKVAIIAARAVPQLRQDRASSARASPAPGSIARAIIPPVTASPRPSIPDISASHAHHAATRHLRRDGSQERGGPAKRVIMTTIGLLGAPSIRAPGTSRDQPAGAARARAGRVWWLVSPGNPLKDPKGMASFESRYRSALAAAPHRAIRVTGNRTGVRHALHVDTLRGPPPPLSAAPLRLADGS